MSNDEEDKVARKLAADLGIGEGDKPPVSKTAYSNNYGSRHDSWSQPPGRSYRKGQQSSLWDDLEDDAEWERNALRKKREAEQGAGLNAKAGGLPPAGGRITKYRSFGELRFAEMGLNELEAALAAVKVEGDVAKLDAAQLDRAADVVFRVMGELLEANKLIWKTEECMEAKAWMRAWIRRLLYKAADGFKTIEEA